MRTLDAKTSTLLVIDLQAKLLPVLEDGEATVRNTRRLIDAATLLGARTIFTEQNPERLGATVSRLSPKEALPKMTFSALRTPSIAEAIGSDGAIVIAGCEAHVCVLQTALDLLDRDRKVYVVTDAVSSRRRESKDTALARLQQNGAELITTEMAVFEWLGTAAHPHFKEASSLIK